MTDILPVLPRPEQLPLEQQYPIPGDTTIHPISNQSILRTVPMLSTSTVPNNPGLLRATSQCPSEHLPTNGECTARVR